ncbi:response regulator transcription factor [Enterococcus ureasiticus]|uniref:winged helix-turn-helix domain-containing protein n=1 Tax=Enterococcus ureasiticus TaxID=903984 RepID=UPI001A8D7F94|nr:winged helix-turn-helix domain-containing protein [Enterococcus ureasiticus]MBO0474542.1 response regulator transcription factor [Enterococcus ureasiticus]
MFNIAVVNDVEISKLECISELKEGGCLVPQIDSGELDERISEMNAVIIIESGLEDIGLTCELIVKVRSLSNCFIWVLSEESTKVKRVIHLQFGEDTTFDSHTDAYEFCLFITKTLERRSGRQANQDKNERTKQSTEAEKAFEIELIPTNFSVKIGEKNEIALTKSEFKILKLLSDRKGEAISYEELYKNIWGKEKGDKKYRVASLIFHLRKKLEDDSFEPKYIRTLRSKGYMLFN